MKKSLFKPFISSVFAPVAIGFVLVFSLLAGTTPVADAQPYYGSYYNYGSSYTGCVALTAFMGPGSTDAETGGQVSILQEFLNQTGYLSGVSGTYDDGTLGAVINYQRAYNIPITGTVGPLTRAAIDQQSCGAGVQGGYGYSAYPVTNYSSGNNCYWTGSTYNSTYVCSNSPVVSPAVPVYPEPVSCTNFSINPYYGNTGNYCNSYNRVILNSLSASYGYNGTTITISGSGFSSSGNTVYFGNTVISNVYSPNGTTLTFTVPATGYYSGTYGISVKNAPGSTSNVLSFVASANNYQYNEYNGNGSYNYTQPYSYRQFNGYRSY